MEEVDVPASSSPCTKLTILRVRDPSEIVSAGTVLGLCGFLFGFMQQLPHLHHLGIEITPQQFPGYVPPGFWLQKLPKTSILMLQLSTSGHEFAETVLYVLKMAQGMEELTILIESPKLQKTHSPGCYCHPYEARTSEDLSLLLLKKVEFKGFTGAKSAINVLKLLLTSASDTVQQGSTRL
ncbi:hypothetical protein ACP70R_043011 [Stipagrostis hirtigluma subsp. patula]